VSQLIGDAESPQIGDSDIGDSESLPVGDSDGRCVGEEEMPQGEVVGSPIRESLERFPPTLAAGE